MARRTSTERHQANFLKAFSRVGIIGRAARAARVSRDAVHYWRCNDPAFAAAFLVAKAQAKCHHTDAVIDALDFFTEAARPLIPSAAWPAVQSALAIVVGKIRFKVRVETGLTPPQTTVGVSMPLAVTEAQATSRQGIETLHHSL